MLGAMTGEAEVQTLVAHGLLELSNYVARRPHLFGCPFAQAGIIHGKAIMVFRDGHNITSTGVVKQLRPCLRIETLAAKHGNEIFVAERGLRPVGGNLVLIYGGSL